MELGSGAVCGGCWWDGEVMCRAGADIAPGVSPGSNETPSSQRPGRVSRLSSGPQVAMAARDSDVICRVGDDTAPGVSLGSNGTRSSQHPGRVSHLYVGSACREPVIWTLRCTLGPGCLRVLEFGYFLGF